MTLIGVLFVASLIGIFTTLTGLSLGVDPAISLLAWPLVATGFTLLVFATAPRGDR